LNDLGAGQECRPLEPPPKAARRFFKDVRAFHHERSPIKRNVDISELCRREGTASMYYGWSKEFLEAGKRRLAGDTSRAATAGEIKDLRRENAALKEVWPTSP
jgi:transposase